MELEYKVAEFLVHNHGILKSTGALVAAYIRAPQIPRTQAVELILDSLAYTVAEHSKFTPLEIEEAFQSEKVQIVLHKYFLKEWQYEH